MMCALAPQMPAENVAHSALKLPDQNRQQAAEDVERTRRIGGRERRLRNGVAAEMIKLAGMALQVGFDVAQAARAGKLREQHRDQMGFGLKAARIPFGIVLLFKPIHSHPRNLLQYAMKNDILVLHGFDPFSRPVDSQTSGIE